MYRVVVKLFFIVKLKAGNGAGAGAEAGAGAKPTV